MDNFKKIYRIGTLATLQKRAYSIYVEVVYKDGKLSLHGVEGPLPNGNCVGSCGQIDMHLDVKDIIPSARWTRPMITRLLEIWKEWHLNDMKAGCEHQRASWNISKVLTVTEYSWTTQYHALVKKASAGELSVRKYREFQKLAAKVTMVTIASNRAKYESELIKELLDEGWIKAGKTEEKIAGHVYPHEHPEGILTKPCEVCGYKYGSAWLRVEVPESVLQELLDFPETDKQPAWI